jgi:hypothetical protein
MSNMEGCISSIRGRYDSEGSLGKAAAGYSIQDKKVNTHLNELVDPPTKA